MNPLAAEELERRCLHTAGGLLAFDKPADLPTSGRDLEDPDCLQYQLMQRHGGMLWAVHQLDADTSGLNLFVTEKRLVQVHKQRMAWPNCEKRYLAVLRGAPVWQAQHSTAPIGPLEHSPNRSLGVTPAGRHTSTHFEILARGAGACLALVRLETGRTHQIRIHAAHLGHPLLGEEWYTSPACTRYPRQALHAHELRFADGTSPRRLAAPLPVDLRELCAQLGLAHPLLEQGASGDQASSNPR